MERAASFLLVDGYNIIFSWDKLKVLAQSNLEYARDQLLDMMCNLSGFTMEQIIVVYDAHRVSGGLGSKKKYKNIWVVFTKEAQTADHYIEQAVSTFDKSSRVRVATSDGLEQIIILAKGAVRVSANELMHEYEMASRDMKESFIDQKGERWGSLYERTDQKTARWLEKLRRR